MRTKHLPLLLFFIAFSTLAIAQEQDLSPWTDNPHGNEWIDYSKKYVRVGITQDGIYRIPLATLRARLGNDLTGNNVQAWFRGSQIALQIDGDNVVFYGRKNDGVSDGLMFRPGPQARLDYTTSFFSEEGAHFFTIAKAGDPVLRISSLSAVPASEGPVTESFHVETIVKNNSEWFTSGATANRRAGRPFAHRAEFAIQSLNNSFYQRHNAFIKLLQTNEVWDEAIDLKDFVAGTDENVRLEFSIHGDGPGERNLEVFMAPENSQLTEIGKRLLSSTLPGLSAIKDSRTVVPGTNITEAGKGYLRFSSTSTVNNSALFRNRFGVSYYTLSFPQSPGFTGQTSKKYFFKAKGAGKSKIRITGVSSGDRVYDISDKNRPVLLNGILSGGNLDLEVNRIADKALILQVVSSAGITEPAAGVFYDVKLDLLYSFKTGDKIDNVRPEPADYDYLVITHNATGEKQVREAAVEFAKYRAKPEGGEYKPLVISTRSIYDQFNYGEPSPVAIGRFVNFMIQSGIKATHNVLLVGYGVGRIDNIIKEIPYDIPTFGDPGSDVLLVSGLSNDPAANIDVPSVPIGRISAFTNEQVMNYLAKVEEYERQTREESSSNLAWRKTVLNLIGNKRSDEPTSFNNFVTQAESQITPSTGPWQVSRVTNEDEPTWPPAPNTDFPARNAPIESNMNDGLGMLTYYGHGDFSGTIYNIGYASSRYQQTSKRYPFVYITGCGVGDVYSSHSGLFVASDWIIAQNKGAIAMYANTFLAYTNTAAAYMKLLYTQIFQKTDATRRTLGGIQVDMARIFTGSSANARVSATDQEIANVHQTSLFGDPAVRILLTSDVPLPVSYVDFSGSVLDNSNIQLLWETATEKDNDHFIVERSFDGKTFEMIGKVPSKDPSDSGRNKYNFLDASPRVGINYYRLKQVDRAGSGEQGFGYSNIISVDLKIRSHNTLISVFPNPGSDKVLITSDRGDIIKSWKLYNSIGAVVSKGQETTVDISNLSSGIFILEVVTANDIVTRKKIIKER